MCHETNAIRGCRHAIDIVLLLQEAQVDLELLETPAPRVRGRLLSCTAFSCAQIATLATSSYSHMDGIHVGETVLVVKSWSPASQVL